MPTKTISLEMDAYERLRAAKRAPRESFSEVVRRAIWPEENITAAELLERTRKRSAFLSEAALRSIERIPDPPPASHGSTDSRYRLPRRVRAGEPPP